MDCNGVSNYRRGCGFDFDMILWVLIIIIIVSFFSYND